jgi:NTP pyrophosphatase (non-canonical NTP hydrolase)
MSSHLTVEVLCRANRDRCKWWHNPSTEPWTGADWSNAMCGEAGEAANVVKKLRRHETGVIGLEERSRSDLRDDLGLEIADTILYALSLADHYAIHVPTALVDKFNFISRREGLPHRLDEVGGYYMADARPVPEP